MKRASQKQRILEYMIRQTRDPALWPMMPAVAYNLCGSLRLSERIRELEADGYVIIRAWRRYDTGQRVMSYRLSSTKRRSR